MQTCLIFQEFGWRWIVFDFMKVLGLPSLQQVRSKHAVPEEVKDLSFKICADKFGIYRLRPRCKEVERSRQHKWHCQ